MDETSPETTVFREANYLSWRLLINENYDNNHVVFDQKCIGEQGTVTGHIVRIQEPVPLFTNFGPLFLHLLRVTEKHYRM